MTTRRNLLKGMAAVAAAVPAAGLQAKEFTKGQKWDKEADVVVVGFGGAGAATPVAVEAGSLSLPMLTMPMNI